MRAGAASAGCWAARRRVQRCAIERGCWTCRSAITAFIHAASRLINALRLCSHANHRRRVKRSRSVLRKLRSFEGEPRCARVIAYLRRIDPLLCEEVVLSALEDAGAFVVRNRLYGGDGGPDGRAWVPGFGWCGPNQALRRARLEPACRRHRRARGDAYLPYAARPTLILHASWSFLADGGVVNLKGRIVRIGVLYSHRSSVLHSWAACSVDVLAFWGVRNGAPGGFDVSRQRPGYALRRRHVWCQVGDAGAGSGRQERV